MKTIHFFSFLCLFSITGKLTAQDGVLDTDFGTGGKRTLVFGLGNDEINAMALQPDGKIVAAGYTVLNQKTWLALARFNADGSTDTGFGANGKVATSFGLSNDAAYGLAVQPDGNIIVVGNTAFSGLSGSALALARYKPDGKPDSSFGVAGKVFTSFGSGFENAAAVALQPDGKIVVAATLAGINKTLFGALRYLPNGVLDPEFSGDGIQTVDFGYNYQNCYALALQPDGKILIAGRSFVSPLLQFALARILPDGQVDAAFGSGGKVLINVDGAGGTARSVAVQPDGKIVLAGYIESGGNHDFALARCLPDGAPDNSFALDGSFVYPLTSADEEAFELLIQPDGKIIAAGNAFTDFGLHNSDFALARFQPDGAVDESFGVDGLATVSISNVEDKVQAMLMQPDGKIVVGGFADMPAGKEFALARFTSGLSMSAQEPTQKAPTISLFPNPTDGDVTIIVEDAAPGQSFHFQLFNAQGQAVLSRLFSGGRTIIQQPELPAGLYFYRIHSANGRPASGILYRN